MKWTNWLFRLTSCVALACFAGGCGEDDTPSDEEIVADLAAPDGEFGDYFDLGSFLGDAPGPEPSHPSPIELAPIVDLDGWHREADTTTPHVTVTIDRDAEPDAAHVVATADIAGTLYLIGKLEGAGNASEYPKPFGDHAERHAAFVRNGSRWELEGISHVNVTSQSPGVENTVRIDSVRIAAEGLAPIVIIGWHEHADLADMLAVPAGVDVTVTVYTNGVDALAYLHSGGRNGVPKFRRPIPSLGGGVFEGTWTTPTIPGVYHAAMDVLQEQTLMDSDAAVGPYDSNVWMLIYRVEGTTGGS